MAYRLPDDRNEIVDVAPPTRIAVDNGTITRFYVPCAYVYDGRMSYPEQPFQTFVPCRWPLMFGPLMRVEPIDLGEEGYDEIDVQLSESVEGLTFEGAVDGSVINLTISAECEDAISNDIEVAYSVYAKGSFENDGVTMQLSDVVVKGTLVIVAGPVEVE